MDATATVAADLLVIGWGKAGKTLARSQARAGRQVVLVEADPLMAGGTCINIGCVPTKALVHRAAERGEREPAAYFTDSMDFRDRLTAKLRQANYAMVADEQLANVVFGQASFVEPHLVRVQQADSDLLVRADQVIINTGSMPVLPEVPGLATSAQVIDSTTAQYLDELPTRLIVYGAGRIGLEMADIFTGFGSQVTVLNRGKRLLASEDADVAASLEQAMQTRGTTFIHQAQLLSVRDVASGIEANIRTPAGDQLLTADKMLVATGRRPRTDGLRLAEVGIETGPRGEVIVDEYLRTSVPGVWAVGDVNGGPQFTYISYDDYRIVAAQLSGDLGPSTADRVAVPNTLFCTPPLGRVGLSEDEARAQGHAVVVKASPVAQIAVMPRPKAVEQTAGLIKLLVDAHTDLILGAAWHSIDAQEVINLIALAMRAGVTASQLRDGIWTHPSTTEALNGVLA